MSGATHKASATTILPSSLDSHIKEMERSARAMGRPLPDGGKAQTVASQSDVGLILKHVKQHVRALRHLVKTAAEGNRHKTRVEAERIMSSFPGRIAALIRVRADARERRTFAMLEAEASQVDVRVPCLEPVVVRSHRKHKGGYRTIASPLWRRRVMQLLLRDVLIAAGLECEHAHARRGRGPLTAIGAVEAAITDGFDHWLIADIWNFYASVELEHLVRFVPVSAPILRNTAFHPEAPPAPKATAETNGGNGAPAKDVVVHATASNAGGAPKPSVTTPTGKEGNEGTTKQEGEGTKEGEGEEGRKSTPEQVRVPRGLPQGSLVSPLLATALLGRVLGGLPGENAIVVFQDDIAIGARTASDLHSLEKALVQRLASLDAGPLHLSTIRRMHSAHFVDFMQFRTGSHYFNRELVTEIHRRPSWEAFFRRRLRMHRIARDYLLDESGEIDRQQLPQCEKRLRDYAKRWMRAMKWPAKGSSVRHYRHVLLQLGIEIDVVVQDALYAATQEDPEAREALIVALCRAA